MRPKKRVLLIDTRLTRRSVRSFVLTTNGFAVFPVESADEAYAICADADPEIAIVCWPMPEIEGVFDRLHKEVPEMRTLLLAEELKAAPEGIMADATLWGRFWTADILERTKLLAARKRGPKKPPAIDRMMDLAERRIA